MAPHRQAGAGIPGRLGRGRPPAERQDRPHERRRQGRSRRRLERPGARRRSRDRPRRRRRGAHAPAHRTDARDARIEALQRPRLALRDQVGRLPRAGGRRRRQGPDLDAQPQRCRDLLPEAPEPTVVDRCPPGHRRWRGRGARRAGPSGLHAPPDQARRPDRDGPRLPGLRPALPRRSVAPRCPARGSQAPPAERAQGASARPVRRPRRGRRRGLLRGREGERDRRRRRQAPTIPLRARKADECLAQAQDPAGAGARGRWLDARGGECARPRGARGRGLRGRQAAVQRQGRVRVHRRDPQGPAGATEAARDRRSAVRSAAAQGLPRPMGRRPGEHHLGPAGARHPGRAGRLVPRRHRPPGRVQGRRARPRPDRRRA